jgi:hypothetical protein
MIFDNSPSNTGYMAAVAGQSRRPETKQQQKKKKKKSLPVNLIRPAQN